MGHPRKQVLPAQTTEACVQAIQYFFHLLWATELELPFEERLKPTKTYMTDQKTTCVQM